jgi:DNA invertase Pin-like site-specific DNA recombinase
MNKENNVTIQVPAQFENKIADLLNQLMLEEKYRTKENKEPEYVVREVLNHKVVDGKYYFLLKFEGFKEPEWISDDNCNCEYQIREYLNETEEKLRTVYCISRVSSQQQTGPNHISLEAQKNRLERVALTYKDARIKYLNISASAYKNIPRAFLDLGYAVKKGDIILIYRVDRLSRNIVEFLSFLEDLNTRGVLMYSQDENIWYHEDKLDFIQKIVDSNREAVTIGKRVKLSVEERRRRGDECLGRPPFGYRFVRGPNNQILKAENLPEQKILFEVKQSFFDKRMKKRQIAEELNRKHLFKRGKKWTTRMLTDTLAIIMKKM